MENKKDTVTLKKMVEKDGAYQFMTGHNEEYDHIRIQILRKEEMSYLNETVSLVNAEKRKR